MDKLNARGFLALAAVLTVVLWQLPHGDKILYPFTLLATYAHEMGHGLTALLLGGSFQRLEMFPDGSGLAYWAGDLGRVSRALVAAGGLVGPSIAGVTVLILSRRHQHAWLLAYVLGGLMLLSALLFTRGLFAPVFVVAAAVPLIAVARWAPQRGAPLLVQLVGVQLCVAVFRDVDYMFSAGGEMGGVRRMSDSAAIAEALFLPYWFWGAVTAAFSFIVLALGLYVALRPGREASALRRPGR